MACFHLHVDFFFFKSDPNRNRLMQESSPYNVMMEEDDYNANQHTSHRGRGGGYCHLPYPYGDPRRSSSVVLALRGANHGLLVYLRQLGCSERNAKVSIRVARNEVKNAVILSGGVS